MRGCEVRWMRQSGGASVVPVFLAACVLWVALRQGQAPADQTERWAAASGGAQPGGLPAIAPAPSPVSVLRPRRRRAHVPPTWQQERDWARADLHSLCQQARQMAGVIEEAGLLSDGADSPAAIAVGREPYAALVRVPRAEAGIRAHLDRARGWTGVLAARREIRGIQSDVSQAQSWLRARRMSGAPMLRHRPPSP